MAVQEVALGNHSNVEVQITYYGKTAPVLAHYDIQLKSAENNPPLFRTSGDNQNSQDDIYAMPKPIADNKGRYVLIIHDVAVVENSTDFEIHVQTLGDGEPLREPLIEKGHAADDANPVRRISLIKFT